MRRTIALSRYTVGDRVVVRCARDPFNGKEARVEVVYPDGGLSIRFVDGGGCWFYSPKDVRAVSA